MPTWLGQIVISKGSKTPFKVQYWRTPSMTPAMVTFRGYDELRNYLRHSRLSGTTADEVIDRLQNSQEVVLTTIESEEAVS
jgi:hypothetical protein